MDIRPVTLDGKHVRLEPLSLDHHADLCPVGLDEELWRWTTAVVRTPEEMRAYLQTALDAQAAGTALPFAVIAKPGSRAIGSTRYMNVDGANRRVEIGSTWYGRDYQRTAVNTESKYPLLRHAFEALGCIRVEFKTDSRSSGSARRKRGRCATT